MTKKEEARLFSKALQLPLAKRRVLAHMLLMSVEAPPGTYATEKKATAQARTRVRKASLAGAVIYDAPALMKAIEKALKS